MRIDFWNKYLIAFLLGVLIPCAMHAGDLKTFDFSRQGLRGARKAATGVNWSKRVQQGYNMKVWLSNQMAMGIEAWDPFAVPTGDCEVGVGLEYPAGSCIEHLFGAAPWIGGIINGVRRVSEGYNGDNAQMEFLPQRQDTARDRMWTTRPTCC